MTRTQSDLPRIERLLPGRTLNAPGPDPHSQWLIEQMVELECSSGLSTRGITGYHSIAEDPLHLILVALPRSGPDRLLGLFAAHIVLDELQIDNIAVTPELRGHGIGSLLLTAGLTLARRADCLTAHLEVRSANLPARQLYLKAGFREVGRRPRYYLNPPDDAITMTSEL
jgi:ribosomal protein S18 acetylase RimI-like enzyme